MSNFLQNALLFPRLLRQAGMPVSLQQSQEFVQALTLVEIGKREQVFFAARSLLLSRREHLTLFETIFNRFWRVLQPMHQHNGQKAPVAPRHKKRKPFTIVNYMAFKARQSDREIEITDKAQTFSNAELLQRKEFSLMEPEELATVRRLISEMRWPICLRQTRRRVANQQGDALHLRRLLRSATVTGGVPLKLAYQSRKIKERPFVLLADISGSMEKYGRLLLQFFYSVSQSYRQVEAFVFGTRLTRITPELKYKNIDQAVDQAARQVVDWSGGTRIGESLHSFNRQWSRRVLRRGAIVLIVSDGWERGDVTQLKQEMRHLQHRCHRLIWLNPLAGRDSYQPQVEGMTAALSHVDDFLPIHNLQSLTKLATHLEKLG